MIHFKNSLSKLKNFSTKALISKLNFTGIKRLNKVKPKRKFNMLGCAWSTLALILDSAELASEALKKKTFRIKRRRMSKLNSLASYMEGRSNQMKYFNNVNEMRNLWGWMPKRLQCCRKQEISYIKKHKNSSLRVYTR